METANMALIRDNATATYRTRRATSASEADILAAAESILRLRVERLGALASPAEARSFLRMRLGHLMAEQFHVIWLDNRHQILAVDHMFSGTLDGASVHPREVVRAALKHNAAACIVAHNHPSGVCEPSNADRDITQELKKALAVVEVRLLDHIVVGGTTTTSMVERGLL
jgi:DNA repair protein RadC